MKKRLVVLILIALFSSFFLEAKEKDSNSYDLSIGFSLAYKDGLIKSLKKTENFSPKDLDLSLELRSKLFLLEAEASGKVKATETNGFKFNGMFGLGIAGDLFNFIRLSFCMGPTTEYVLEGSKGSLVIDGRPIEGASFPQVFKKSRFNFRLSLDFMLGPVLKVGASVSVPTDFSIENNDLTKLLPRRRNFENSTLCFVFCMTLV